VGRFGDNPVGPGSDFAALRSSQDGLCDAFEIGDHIHTFQHRFAAVFDENGNNALANKPTFSNEKADLLGRSPRPFAASRGNAQ
jgi:hypothetical protein